MAGMALWLMLWLAVTAVAMYLKPSPLGHGTHTQLGLPPCPSVLVFDKPCPGCGLTTSFTATVHGKLGQAFKAHPLGPPVYGIFTFSAILCAYGIFRRRRLDTDVPAFNWCLAAGVTVFVLFGVLRFVYTEGYDRGDLRRMTQLERSAVPPVSPASSEP
jgi:hypothetical protein